MKGLKGPGSRYAGMESGALSGKGDPGISSSLRNLGLEGWKAVRSTGERGFRPPAIEGAAR